MDWDHWAKQRHITSIISIIACSKALCTCTAAYICVGYSKKLTLSIHMFTKLSLVFEVAASTVAGVQTSCWTWCMWIMGMDGALSWYQRDAEHQIHHLSASAFVLSNEPNQSNLTLSERSKIWLIPLLVNILFLMTIEATWADFFCFQMVHHEDLDCSPTTRGPWSCNRDFARTPLDLGRGAAQEWGWNNFQISNSSL